MNKHLFKYRLLLFFKFISILLEAILALVIAFLMGYTTDCIMNKDLNQLMKSVGLLAIVMVAQFIIIYMYVYSQGKFVKFSIKDFKDSLFNSIINYDIKRFNSESTASYISTLTTDINIIEKKYYNSIFEIFNNITLLIGGIACMLYIHPLMAACVVGTGLFMLLIPVIFNKTLGTRQKNYSTGMENFRVTTQDNLSGFEIIKSFNIAEKFFSRFTEVNNKSEEAKMKFNNFSQSINETCKFLSLLIQLALTGMGVFFVLKGELTFGLCISSVQLMNYILEPMSALSGNISVYKSVKPIKDKLFNILNNADDKGCDEKGEELLGFNESIEFKDINFSYTEERKILDGISFKINKGEKYAIVGGSGCGKSTLVKLLLRFYDNYTGTIKIDNKDVKTLNPSSLYEYICPIEQKVYMMQDTIENNIKLYKDYNSQLVQDAIEKSGLSDLVKSLDNGIKTVITEDGGNFSGGESQRISIARALVRQTPILILDEATSSLDSMNAYNIENSIISIKDLTCMVVTHKLNSDILSKYDKIIVLKDGKVEEMGSFEELIEKKEYFYSLYNVTTNISYGKEYVG